MNVPAKTPLASLGALCAAAALALLPILPAGAGELEREFPFELDTWYDLGVEDGPVTLHRIRIAHQSGNFKSKVFRPGNSEYLESVQIQIEYSNAASRDYEADLAVHWLDAEGRVIDGYDDEEDMDEEESHEEMTALLSTLKYGLEVATTLSVKISW